MGRYNKNLGDFGEAVAENYLLNCGYEIVEKNYSVKGGEIDIIAKDGKILVFTEVKARSSIKFGYPAEAVDYRKIGHIKKAAEMYLLKNPPTDEVRFDIIEVYAEFKDGIPSFDKINHIKEIIID